MSTRDKPVYCLKLKLQQEKFYKIVPELILWELRWLMRRIVATKNVKKMKKVFKLDGNAGSLIFMCTTWFFIRWCTMSKSHKVLCLKVTKPQSYKLQMSLRHTVSMWLSHNASLSLSHNVSMSLNHNVSMSLSHNVTKSQRFNVTKSWSVIVLESQSHNAQCHD